MSAIERAAVALAEDRDRDKAERESAKARYAEALGRVTEGNEGPDDTTIIKEAMRRLELSASDVRVHAAWAARLKQARDTLDDDAAELAKRRPFDAIARDIRLVDAEVVEVVRELHARKRALLAEREERRDLEGYVSADRDAVGSQVAGSPLRYL